ncbi:hypothetical protein CLV92_1193 [Kineococcus xinjiangensis]|uniref:PIN domain-containing protein n=1 Tax=Kineococcus xinjiangensis TaxID=512762 RepID=A0A2S6ICG9_9ACTN|nr:PIN domain-containing protein [Kineococcus xinjiangensis]PPK91922.1 hypothetical protein CLV92_1193 [Kineococcus xinjiangensis]
MSGYLLDTCSVLNLLAPPPGAKVLIPLDAATFVSAVTDYELRFGVAVATADPAKAAKRMNQLMAVTAHWQPLPVDSAVTAAYSSIAAGVIAAGQQLKDKRMADLLLAATALAHDLTFVTNDKALTRAVADTVPVTALL